MMALRICVLRHGRLPQTIVTDGGKEFASVYFQSLLAAYECTRKTRPPASVSRRTGRRFGAGRSASLCSPAPSFIVKTRIKRAESGRSGAKRLADFMNRVEGDEALLCQRDRDAETGLVITLAEGGKRYKNAFALREGKVPAAPGTTEFNGLKVSPWAAAAAPSKLHNFPSV